MSGDAAATARALIDFVVREARLLDEKRYDEWNALFTDDALYWVPLVPDQPDGLNHTSHLYEDKLLRELRIERLKSPRAFSQQPPSRCHHLLQTPTVEDDRRRAGNRYRAAHASSTTPSRRATSCSSRRHRLPPPGCGASGALRMTLKRVDLLNCDAALPAVQLFI